MTTQAKPMEGSITRLRLKRGDMVVLTLPEGTPEEESRQVGLQFKELLDRLGKRHVDVVVLPPGYGVRHFPKRGAKQALEQMLLTEDPQNMEREIPQQFWPRKFIGKNGGNP